MRGIGRPYSLVATMTGIDWHHPFGGLRTIRRGTAPITRIQIYGQRCSGTNIVARTIEENLPTARLVEDFGFKHWFVPPQTLFPNDTLVIVVARDAFDWVRSLHRQPWHAHPDLKAKPFPQFIRSDWHSCWDEHFDHVEDGHPMFGKEMMHERDPDTGKRFVNCIAKRTAKLRHWAGLPERSANVALVSYDAFIRAPAAFVAEIARVTGLEHRVRFVPVASYKGQGHFRYTPTAYGALTPNDVAHIETWLDPATEATFGLPAHYGHG